MKGGDKMLPENDLIRSKEERDKIREFGTKASNKIDSLLEALCKDPELLSLIHQYAEIAYRDKEFADSIANTSLLWHYVFEGGFGYEMLEEIDDAFNRKKKQTAIVG